MINLFCALQWGSPAVWILIAVAAALVVALITVPVLVLHRRAAKARSAQQSAPAPAAEEVPAPAPAPVKTEAPEPIPEPVTEEVRSEVGTFRYDKSFTAKLIQSDDEVKHWYGELKNELLGWGKTRVRMSWKKESYRIGREPVAVMTFRGKTLCLLLPLDPKKYSDGKYKIEDISGLALAGDTPCLYRIKNDRRVKYAKELIAAVMENLAGERVDRARGDYYVPFEDTAALVQRGLIKLKEANDSEFAARAKEEAAISAAAPIPEKNNSESGTVRYDKSFTAKMIQSDDEIKTRYSLIKNHLLSYQKVKERLSWKQETYRYGGEPVAKLAFRGKALCLYLPLNAADYDGSKYKLEDVSGLASAADLPSVYRIKNDRRAKYATELIDVVMKSLGGTRTERESVDYRPPYEETDELLSKGLVKLKISTAEADAFLASRSE